MRFYRKAPARPHRELGAKASLPGEKDSQGDRVTPGCESCKRKKLRSCDKL